MYVGMCIDVCECECPAAVVALGGSANIEDAATSRDAVADLLGEVNTTDAVVEIDQIAAQLTSAFATFARCEDEHSACACVTSHDP